MVKGNIDITAKVVLSRLKRMKSGHPSVMGDKLDITDREYKIRSFCRSEVMN